MLKIVFTQDFEVDDMFSGAASGSKPSLFLSNYLFSFGKSLLELQIRNKLYIIILFTPSYMTLLNSRDFHQDFTRMTDEAYSAVSCRAVGCSLSKCNDQRLSPWGQKLFGSPGFVFELCQYISHGLPTRLNKLSCYEINSGGLF